MNCSESYIKTPRPVPKAVQYLRELKVQVKKKENLSGSIFSGYLCQSLKYSQSEHETVAWKVSRTNSGRVFGKNKKKGIKKN